MIATLKWTHHDFLRAASHFHSLSLSASIKKARKWPAPCVFHLLLQPSCSLLHHWCVLHSFSCCFCQMMLDGSSRQSVLWQQHFNFNLVVAWLQLSNHRLMLVFRILILCLKFLTRPFSSRFSLYHWTPFFVVSIIRPIRLADFVQLRTFPGFFLIFNYWCQQEAFAPRLANVQRKTPLSAEAPNVSGPPYSGPAIKPILDSVNVPADMKRLDMRQLKQVSKKKASLELLVSLYTCQILTTFRS